MAHFVHIHKPYKPIGAGHKRLGGRSICKQRIGVQKADASRFTSLKFNNLTVFRLKFGIFPAKMLKLGHFRPEFCYPCKIFGMDPALPPLVMALTLRCNFKSDPGINVYYDQKLKENFCESQALFSFFFI